jgi:prevent-host-death family protein
MKIAKLSEAKDDLSRYVDYVRRGGTVRILLRGVPVADLVPIEAGDKSSKSAEHTLADLERRSILRRGSGSAWGELLDPGPSIRGPSVIEDIREERERGW